MEVLGDSVPGEGAFSVLEMDTSLLYPHRVSMGEMRRGNKLSLSSFY